MRYATLPSVLLLASTIAEAQTEDSPEPPRPAQYVVLDDAATRLRNDFNAAAGSVRLLFVVDPSCPGCMHGLSDVNRDLLARTTDPRIKTFVVHVPVVGATEKDISISAKILRNDQVRHYWNASGVFGRKLGDAMNLKHGNKPVYAWDVWLVYGPEVKWTGESPPKPELLMHQLWELEGSAFPKLDSKAFADRVLALASKLPAGMK